MFLKLIFSVSKIVLFSSSWDAFMISPRSQMKPPNCIGSSFKSHVIYNMYIAIFLLLLHQVLWIPIPLLLPINSCSDSGWFLYPFHVCLRHRRSHNDKMKCGSWKVYFKLHNNRSEDGRLRHNIFATTITCRKRIKVWKSLVLKASRTSKLIRFILR